MSTPGHRIAEYVCDRRVAEAPGGAVWRGRHADLPGSRIALLVAEDPRLASALPAVARAEDGLAGAPVLLVRGAGVDGATAYLALEEPPGEWLAERLARGPASPVEARLIVEGVCTALSDLHAAGLAQGALAPWTIHLGEGGVVRLAFPTLRAGADAPAAAPTEDLRALGPLAFMLLTATRPGEGIPPGPTSGLPEWATRLMLRTAAGGYRSAGEVRADLARLTDVGAPVRFLEDPLPVAEPAPIALPVARAWPVRLVRGAVGFAFLPSRIAAAGLRPVLPGLLHLAWAATVVGGIAYALDLQVTRGWRPAAPAGANGVVPAPRSTVGWFRDLPDDARVNAAVVALRDVAVAAPERFRVALRTHLALVEADDDAAWAATARGLARLSGPAATLALDEVEAAVSRGDPPALRLRTLRAWLRDTWVGEEF